MKETFFMRWLLITTLLLACKREAPNATAVQESSIEKDTFAKPDALKKKVLARMLACSPKEKSEAEQASDVRDFDEMWDEASVSKRKTLERCSTKNCADMTACVFKVVVSLATERGSVVQGEVRTNLRLIATRAIMFAETDEYEFLPQEVAQTPETLVCGKKTVSDWEAWSEFDFKLSKPFRAHYAWKRAGGSTTGEAIAIIDKDCSGAWKLYKVVVAQQGKQYRLGAMIVEDYSP